jgi:hypothetical protein
MRRPARPQPPSNYSGHDQQQQNEHPWCSTLFFLDPDLGHRASFAMKVSLVAMF